MYIIKAGVLYSVRDGVHKEFVSSFAEEFYNEEHRTWERESWKYKEDNQGQEGGLVTRNMLWGGGGKPSAPARVSFTAVFATKDRLYYVLEMSKSSGLFYYDFATGQEMRLFHRADFKPQGLWIGDDHSILTTIENADGTVHLVRYDGDGRREHVLTSGDCKDENPIRVGSKVYYQSRGIARNQQGIAMATGPASICVLDIDTGDISTVLEHPKSDFMLPRIAPDGCLYCIRAPYQTGPSYPFKNLLLDIVLFPWRLIVAVFGFLNVFSMFFAKKPLTTAGGPARPPMDISTRVIHDRVVNLQQTWREEGRKVAVSKQWTLVRQADGKLNELASNVLWFDLDVEGQPCFTDGYRLYDASGSKQFETDDLITCLARFDAPRESSTTSASA